jgi:hypothetical protein
MKQRSRSPRPKIQNILQISHPSRLENREGNRGANPVFREDLHHFTKDESYRQGPRPPTRLAMAEDNDDEHQDGERHAA